jgi:uncharacterized NAD(P)/FAD-binding protein YdhS
VALMGVGLTAVDTVLALRDAGYVGEIVAFSRHGFLPQVHQQNAAAFSFDRDALFAQKSLPALLHFMRAEIKRHGEWRGVIDALRPYTQTLWQRLSAAERRKFLTRLLSFWSVHRHRMAPQIAMRMQNDTLRVIGCKKFSAAVAEGEIALTFHRRAGDEMLHPSRIINCTGPELNVAKSSQALLKQMLADGLVEPHETQLGIATDPQGRAWGAAYPNLYAMGALMTGQWLESTAVPELRAQAATIAKALTA